MVIHRNVALKKLDYNPLYLYGEGADGGEIVDILPPHLDVKVSLGGVTQGGQYVVAGIGQLEELFIKCTEVEVSPCAAHLNVVIHVDS